MRRRTVLVHEHTVEREGEEVWALWEEVGSRGLDTWTGLAAMYSMPDGSGSQPAASTPRRAGKGGRKVRALLCHYCRHHLEAEDDEALFGFVRDHLIQEHHTIVPTDEQVGEIVSTRSYHLEYAPVPVGSTAFEEEGFGPDPY
jgi:hypothetical protein